MGADGVAHIGMLFVFLGQFHAEDCMRQLGVGLGHFADVVEQTGAFGQLGVQAQLRGHGGGEVGYFAAVLQQVLPVGGAVFHASYHAHELVVHVVDAKVDAGAFAHFGNLLLNLAAGLGHHFLNACGVDAAVGDEFVQRQTGYLAAHGVEATDDDGVGRVVDDYLHAGE